MFRLCQHKAKLTLVVWLVLIGALVYFSSVGKNKGLHLEILNGDGPLLLLSDPENDKQTSRKKAPPTLYKNTGSANRSMHITEQRAMTLKRRCKQYQNNIRETTSGEEKFFTEHVIVNTSLELMYCSVPKVANTNFRRMLLGMYGVLSPEMALSARGYQIYQTYAGAFTYLQSFSETNRQEIFRKFRKFIFVREPLERLISAFHSKFHHPNAVNRQVFCGSVKRFYARNRWLPHSKVYQRDFEKERMNFREFMIYLTDFHEVGEIPNEHFAPFHTLCNPCEVAYDYVGKYDTLVPDATYIFGKLEWDASFPPKNENNTFRPSASYVDEYLKEIPVDIRQKVWNMYKMDYILFDYIVPLWLEFDSTSLSEA